MRAPGNTSAFATVLSVLLLAAMLAAACAQPDSGQTDASEGSGVAGAEDEAGEEESGPAPGVSREDARLAGAVLAQFTADPALDATEVDVAVEDGTATIVSRTESAAAWARARDLAALVPGVGQVLMATPAPSAEGSGEPSSAPVQLRDVASAFADASAFGQPPLEPLEMVAEGSSDTIAAAASGDRPRTYVVQSGDSLSIIAQRTMGDGLAWPRIFELNRSVIGANPQAPRVGMELRIPQD